jgi:hypothetical protein
MNAPVARPVASSMTAQILSTHRPIFRNLPLTTNVKVGDK